ncbi:type IV pilus modification protein PilV [Legionella sp. W05-934-2]|jgi:type IV pilus assembly protein PilV|uniref:type IV pilus modification protein PilV n=1 Tax=Legionella sp. W05-934-2 TaxID=1198649 RepID=UPI003462D39A
MKKQQGFSLLEVLISVVVLSVGMLGIAALQANAIKYNQSAQLRAVAITQVGNMADRMLANSAGIQAGAYDNITGIPSNPSCTVCTSAEVAQRDAYEWNTINGQLLPNGQGTVTRNGTLLLITMRWDNSRTGATGLNCGGDPTVDLTCLSVEVQL